MCILHTGDSNSPGPGSRMVLPAQKGRKPSRKPVRNMHWSLSFPQNLFYNILDIIIIRNLNRYKRGLPWYEEFSPNDSYGKICRMMDEKFASVNWDFSSCVVEMTQVTSMFIGSVVPVAGRQLPAQNGN